MGVCEMPSSNGRMAVGPSSELTRRWYRPRSSSGISTRRCLVWQGVIHLASANMKARIHDRFPHRGHESNNLLSCESLLAGGHLPICKRVRLSSPSPNPKACRLYSSLLNTRPRQQKRRLTKYSATRVKFRFNHQTRLPQISYNCICWTCSPQTLHLLQSLNLELLAGPLLLHCSGLAQKRGSKKG